MSLEGRPWLITAAVGQEIEGIRSGLRAQGPILARNGNAWSAQWRGNPVLLVRTGVGPERVRQGLAPYLAAEGFSGIVSTGYAGGLRNGCRLGDILVPAEIQSVPPLREARIKPDGELRERVLDRLRIGSWRIHTDRMITSERVIVSTAEKIQMGRRYDAGSVEMESAVIGELAEKASIPFVVVRVVLDEASFSLPDMMKVFRSYRKRQYGEMILHVATHPYKLWGLLRLLQRSRSASRSLNRLFFTTLLDVLVEMG